MKRLVSLEAVERERERERERELHFKNQKCNIVQQSDTQKNSLKIIEISENIENKAMCFSGI